MAEMTQKQAIEMVTNLRFYAQQAVIGAPDNRITHEEKANKAAGEIIAALARLAACRVPDELMAAIATLFHGYCRLEDTGLKFTMQVGPEPYLQIGIDPHAHVKAWRVIHDTLYPAAPAPEVKK